MVRDEPSFARVGLMMALLLGGTAPFLQGMGPCGQPPLNITITSPNDGDFNNAGVVTVTGTINRANTNHTVDVNGIPAPVLADRTWSVDVTLDSVAVFNTLKATVTNSINPAFTDKAIVTVIAGDSLDENELALDAVAVRINESALDGLQPLIESLVSFDIASLVPPGTLVLDDYCYQDSFLGCLGRVDVRISGSPPPSIDSFTFALDSEAGFIEVDPTLNNLEVTANVDSVTGIPFSCTVDIDAATTTIASDINLEPFAPDPTNVDAIQLGGVGISFTQFNDDTDCAGFLGGIVEFFIGLVVGSFEGLVRDGCTLVQLPSFSRTISSSLITSTKRP